MHDEQTIDVCAPWPTIYGRAVEAQSNPDAAAADTAYKGNDNKINGGGDELGAAHALDGIDILDFEDGPNVGNVEQGGTSSSNVEDIANNVDDFLDNFLGLSGAESAVLSDSLDFNMGMDFTEEELACLINPDTFGASPSVLAESPAVTPQACPPTGAMTVAAVTVVPPPTANNTDYDGEIVATAAIAAAAAALAAGTETTIAREEEQDILMRNPQDISEKERMRRQKVARYLEKKKRRRPVKDCSYPSRKRVANARPRDKGRFVPLESEFVSVAELQRRTRVRMLEMQQAAASSQQEASVEDMSAGDSAGTSP